MTSQTINLNLIPGSIEPVINVSQYDKGQTWNFNIYSGSQPFTIPTGSSITIQGTKPDKTGFQYGCTFSGNVVTAIEQQQMTILSGKVPAEIVITKDDELIGSLNFNIMVEKAALADDTAISETDLPLIEEAVEALSHIDETLETMEGYKEDSEAYAIGKRNGSDVGSSDPAYHNNSKYYAGQASSSASSASGSATSAGTNALISEGYAVGKQNGSAVGSGSPYYQNNAEYYKGQAANSATNAGNSATAASGSATTASNKALVAEGYADGKQNGTDVASGSPYYHNNSRYYSEQAAASAQSAAQSAASFTVDSALSTSSTNPVQNKVITTDLNNVKQALSNEVATRAELGAHNLGKRFKDGVSSAGITIKDAPNGGNYVNNTATGSGGRLVLISDTFVLKAGTYSIVGESSDHSKYSSVVLQKASDNSVLGSYLISNGTVDKSQATVTLAADTECYFGFNTYSGTAYGTDTFIIYPMVKLVDDKDDTFYPYAKPNTELTKDIKGLTDNQFENGCVNLLENKGTDTVQEGVAFTLNSDGSIKAYGTLGANKNATFTIHPSDTFPNMVGKRVKLSGCPKVTGFFTRITAYRVESVDGSSGTVFDTGDGVAFDFLNDGTGTKVQFYIEINNQTSSPISINTTYKPMITLADVPNSDYAHYVPYVKSNRELTKDVEDLSNAQYFDFTTETSVYANTSAQPMTHTIANDGTYRVSLTSKDVDAQNGATLLINGVTIGTVRADIMENNISRILKLKKGAVITNTNSGTARYRTDVIKLS